MVDRIELLGPSVLDRERPTVEAIKRLATANRVHLGWHYLLDIPWLIRQFSSPAGERFLDAGAGVGVIQWYLAEAGAHVLSVDRTDRSHLSARFRSRYRVMGMRPEDLGSMASSLIADLRRAAIVVDVPRYARDLAARAIGRRAPGSVTVLRANLAELGMVPDASIDNVVAVSSLEHNEPDKLGPVFAELWRVLKPGGTFAATVGAAARDDWFHEPSQGWCYSEASIRRHFSLPDDVPSNFHEYDRLLDETRQNAELRSNLPRAYFKSGNNGMPWGKWDPKYLSVGVRRDKPA